MPEPTYPDIFVKIHGSTQLAEDRLALDIEILAANAGGLVPHQPVEITLNNKTQRLTTDATGRARLELVFPIRPGEREKLLARASGAQKEITEVEIVPPGFEETLKARLAEGLKTEKFKEENGKSMPPSQGEIRSASGRYIDHGDETITDTETGLMWAKRDCGSVMDWNTSDKYVKQLKVGGHSDWRLPTAFELQMISGTNFDESIFSRSSHIAWYWSSEKTGPSRARVVGLGLGAVREDAVGGSSHEEGARAVRP